MSRESLESAAADVINRFEIVTGLRGLTYEIKERSVGAALIILLGTPTDRFYGLLNTLLDALPDDNVLKCSTTLKKIARKPWLESPEARLLQQELGSILTVDRFSFKQDFFSRYIPSVFGAEAQIASAANHVVFGRRGSGKSSLLVFGMRRLEEEGKPLAWIDMQAYEGHDTHAATVAVLVEVMEQLFDDATPVFPAALGDELRALAKADDVTSRQIRRLVAPLRKALGRLGATNERVTIFLDDVHLLAPAFQPEFLALLYAIARGNRTYLKISSIEGFTRLWDAAQRKGLEIPDDAQAIRLDYNLTRPAQSLKHVTEILTAHATYCGLPSVTVLCSRAALSRLVWLAAGVPRDAIYIFSQAMTLAATKGQKSLTVTSLNTAASTAAEDKMRFVAKDSIGAQAEALAVLERLKEFCIKKKRKNAFLVEIVNEDSTYEAIRDLVDLRLLHVLNPGITPGAAGKRYVALLLDYGFYTGLRAAKSVDLFQKEATTPTAKELRKLPRFPLSMVE